MASEFPDFNPDEPSAAPKISDPHALLNGILESSLDGIAVLRAVRNDEKEIVAFDWVLANSVAAHAVDKSKQEVEGSRVGLSFPGLPNLFKDYVQVVESGRPLKHEFQANRETRSVWLDINVVKHEDGLALSFRDITELREMSLELKNQSNRDGLTGVMNKRAFNETLDREWRHCQRAKKPLSLLIYDLDFFRRYNDLYGPQRGDDCLKQVATVLGQSALRPRDFLARYGGEEFVMILAETPMSGAQTVARGSQEKLAELKISHSASSLSDFLTMSIGIATTTPGPHQSLASFIQLAEKSLLQAKEQGRNTVHVLSTDPS